VPLDDGRGVRQPGGERRNAWLNEVVHVLRPEDEQLAGQLPADERREEVARARLGALERDAVVQELTGGLELLGHEGASNAGAVSGTRPARGRASGSFEERTAASLRAPRTIVSGATNEFDYRDSPSIIHILPGASVTPQAKQVAQPNLPCCDAACET